MTGNAVYLQNRERKRLQYERDGDALHVDGERLTISSRARKEVLWLLLSSVGRVVLHEEIAAVCGRGSRDDDPSSRSSKFMAEFRRELGKLRPLTDLVRSVRSLGYTVSDDWTKPPPEIRIQKSNDFLAALDHVVDECIKHSDEHSIVTCQNGLQYMDFDIDFAIQKYQMLDSMLWDTVRILSISAKPSDLIDLKRTFHDLASYVLYWRLGDGLTEEKWRSDYRDEISTRAQKIRRQVEALLADIP